MPKHSPTFDKLGKIRADIRILIRDIEDLPTPIVEYPDYCLLEVTKEIVREAEKIVERMMEEAKNGR